MANYVIDPEHLNARVPAGTELDDFDGNAYVSMVAFKFLNTKIKSIAIPCHRDFEEINLRFYVRRKAGGEWKRGVVFVKEIVPRMAISFIARTLYNENYVTLPSRHTTNEAGSLLRYEWQTKKGWNFIEAKAEGHSLAPGEGSLEQFISEHYWGYTSQRDGSTKEYEVEHPAWKIWRCSGVRT